MSTLTTEDGPAPESSTVVVLDYGSGNLRSAERALAATGCRVRVTADRDEALAADGLVVPGVGAFAACVEGLRTIGGEEIIADRVGRGAPVLAICVGHQVLFAEGVEHGVRSVGCRRWPGIVRQLEATRLPHMGWNTVRPPAGSPLFAGVEQQRFYFVHSYGVRADDAGIAGFGPQARLTWASHEGRAFLAGVEDGPLSSTQFHPEKSGSAGARLLRNWVATL